MSSFVTKKFSASCLIFVLVTGKLLASYCPPDTSKSKKPSGPKHYFMPTVFGSWYSTPERKLINANATPLEKNINAKLKTYSYSQSNTGFYVPLWTKDKFKGDSSTIANWHLLLTGNFQNARPVFGGVPTNHVFCKYSVGTRLMYNSGKRDVYFLDFSPFVSFDKAYDAKKQVRGASTFVWSHLFSEKFSVRLGYTRTFIFGDRHLLPLIGFRVGRLDKTYLSVQFPRNIFLNIPVVKKVSFNILAKPVGGVFDFKDVDSLYTGVNKNIIFGRRDICFGFGFDFHPSKYFSAFVQAGATSGNSSISFFSKESNTTNKVGEFKWFYNQDMRRSSFITIGLTVRFGKAKAAYGNKNIYELMNLNSEIDPGDNNLGPNSSEITPANELKKINKIKYKDIEDLINDGDLYD
jgi:hypothetical protein